MGFSATFSGVPLATYWNDAEDFAEATLVPVSATTPRLDLNVRLTSEFPLPLETSVPVITGTPSCGCDPRGRPGCLDSRSQWEYQWMVDGAPIDGATGPSLVVPAELVGKRISVELTGWLTGYTPEPVLSARRPPSPPSRSRPAPRRSRGRSSTGRRCR